jgi:hypothetical protein
LRPSKGLKILSGKRGQEEFMFELNYNWPPLTEELIQKCQDHYRKYGKKGISALVNSGASDEITVLYLRRRGIDLSTASFKYNWPPLTEELIQKCKDHYWVYGETGISALVNSGASDKATAAYLCRRGVSLRRGKTKYNLPTLTEELLQKCKAHHKKYGKKGISALVNSEVSDRETAACLWRRGIRLNTHKNWPPLTEELIQRCRDHYRKYGKTGLAALVNPDALDEETVAYLRGRGARLGPHEYNWPPLTEELIQKCRDHYRKYGKPGISALFNSGASDEATFMFLRSKGARLSNYNNWPPVTEKLIQKCQDHYRKYGREGMAALINPEVLDKTAVLYLRRRGVHLYKLKYNWPPLTEELLQKCKDHYEKYGKKGISALVNSGAPDDETVLYLRRTGASLVKIRYSAELINKAINVYNEGGRKAVAALAVESGITPPDNLSNYLYRNKLVKLKREAPMVNELTPERIKKCIEHQKTYGLKGLAKAAGHAGTDNAAYSFLRQRGVCFASRKVLKYNWPELTADLAERIEREYSVRGSECFKELFPADAPAKAARSYLVSRGIKLRRLKKPR